VIDAGPANTQDLIALLESGRTETIVLSTIGSNTSRHGEVLPQLLHGMPRPMKQYRHHRPRIDRNILWHPAPTASGPTNSPSAIPPCGKARQRSASCRTGSAKPASEYPPGPDHAAHLFGFLSEAGTAGKLATVAQLAALAVEHQVILHRSETDFARFPGLHWENPLRKT
jgi:hypothetical protein